MRESDYQSGVYYQRTSWSSDGYHLVKIHDETGKLLPETLLSGWHILYKDKDGSGWYRRGQIDSISEESVVLDLPYVAIDVSQVVGVEVNNGHYKDREVVFSFAHILPDDDLRIEINTTDDVHFRGKIINRYTSEHARVRVRKDLYYIRQDHGEHVFTRHSSLQDDRVQIGGYAFLLERDNLIMIEDLTIMDE